MRMIGEANPRLKAIRYSCMKAERKRVATIAGRNLEEKRARRSRKR